MFPSQNFKKCMNLINMAQNWFESNRFDFNPPMLKTIPKLKTLQVERKVILPRSILLIYYFILRYFKIYVHFQKLIKKNI